MAYQAKPGTHQLTVRGTYSLGLQRRGRLTSAGYWMGELLGMIGLSLGEGWRPARQYECEFEIPFEVTVVPQEEAETIELVSSAQLDATMTKAFQVRSSGHSIPYRTASGEVRHEHLKAVFYRSLPMTVAFRLQLRLSKGSEDGAPFECTRLIRAQAGSSGKLVLNPWEFSIKEPGVYSGTVVLISDPNIAYADPAIKAIWGGTLEFPISFTIHPELNCP